MTPRDAVLPAARGLGLCWRAFHFWFNWRSFWFYVRSKLALGQREAQLRAAASIVAVAGLSRRPAALRLGRDRGGQARR
jgi:hypothetical protein